MKKCSFLIKIEIRLKSEMSIFYSNRKEEKISLNNLLKIMLLLKKILYKIYKGEVNEKGV